MAAVMKNNPHALIFKVRVNTMITAPAFDATAWITQRTLGGTDLLPEATAAVANFTMMWNLFEGVLCGNHANIREFERIAQELSGGQLSTEETASLDECLAFWSFRYRTPEGFASRFDRLNFRPNDKRNLVEEVLSGTRHELSDRALALMIIAYRLRNNLFHGLKTIKTLNNQVHNLNTASRCLGALLAASHAHLVRSKVFELHRSGGA